MDNTNKRRNNMFLPFICLVIIIGLFCAGIWPMNGTPINQRITIISEGHPGRSLKRSSSRFGVLPSELKA
jgi:hypothetical protein